MAGETRQADDFLNHLVEEGNAYKYSFYRVCREIDKACGDSPRLGTGPRPGKEKVRFGQEAFFDFSPSALREVTRRGDGRVRIMERFLGLFGPQGPMPMQFTDYVRDRSNHYHDTTINSFLDIFHHRAASLFYRSWAIGRAEVSYDRPDEDYFGDLVSCLVGVGYENTRNRDAVPDHAKLYFSGCFSGYSRNPEKMRKLLREFFEVEVDLEEFVGQWYPTPADNRCRLGGAEAVLGESAMLGEQFYDGNLKFRLRFGPLDYQEYSSLLPSGKSADMLYSWVNLYFGHELDWDVVLVLKHQEVPQTRLGETGRLGWTSWMKADEVKIKEDQEVCYNLSV